MDKEELRIEDKLADLEYLLRRASLLENDNLGNYFGNEINNKDDLCLLGGIYYETAGEKATIALESITKAMAIVKEFQDELYRKDRDARNALEKQEENIGKINNIR